MSGRLQSDFQPQSFGSRQREMSHNISGPCRKLVADPRLLVMTATRTKRGINRVRTFHVTGMRWGKPVTVELRAMNRDDAIRKSPAHPGGVFLFGAGRQKNQLSWNEIIGAPVNESDHS